MFVTSGFDAADGIMTEILDVSGEGRACPKPAEFNKGHYSDACGGFVKDRSVVCGGYVGANPANPSNKCWEFRLDDDNDGAGANDGDNGVGKWHESLARLKKARGGARAVQIDYKTIWITGGSDNTGSELSTTEIFVNQGSRPYIIEGPDMMSARRDHCALKISADEILFLGGSPYQTGVWLYNWRTSLWSQKADMPAPKSGAYCGVVTDEDGDKEVVVSEGVYGSPNSMTYVYSVKTDSWRDDGPPHRNVGAINGLSVQYGDSFLTVFGDGFDDGTIYEYNAAANRWDDLKNVEAEFNHYNGVAMLIPDTFYACEGDPTPEP